VDALWTRAASGWVLLHASTCVYMRAGELAVSRRELQLSRRCRGRWAETPCSYPCISANGAQLFDFIIYLWSPAILEAQERHRDRKARELTAQSLRCEP